MKDWLFYPLAIMVIAAMVIFAYTRGDAEAVPVGTDFVVEGETLSTFYAAQGVSFSIAGDTNNPNAYAVLSAHVSRENAPPSAGVFVTLPPAYKEMYAGQTLRISVIGRKGRASKLKSFDVAYISTDAGASGWQSFKITSEFEEFGFQFTPKKSNAGGTDYVGIWPDVDGESRTLDVKSLKIEIFSPDNE